MKEKDLHPNDKSITVEIEARSTAAKARVTGKAYQTSDGIKIVLHNTQSVKSVKDSIRKIEIICDSEEKET